MKKMLWAAMVSVVVAGSVAISGCGGGDDDDGGDYSGGGYSGGGGVPVLPSSSLVGSWVWTDDASFMVTFSSDGSYSTTAEGMVISGGSWSTSGSTMTVRDQWGTETATYSIYGNTLSITQNGETETYTRL